MEGEEEAAGEVAALVEEELPPLPGKPINPVIAPLRQTLAGDSIQPLAIGVTIPA